MSNRVRFHPLDVLAAALAVAAIGLIGLNVLAAGPSGAGACVIVPLAPHHLRLLGLPVC